MCAGLWKAQEQRRHGQAQEKKMEMAVLTGAESAEVEIDTAIAREPQKSIIPTAQAASPERVRSAAVEAKWQAACDAFLRRQTLKRKGCAC